MPEPLTPGGGSAPPAAEAAETTTTTTTSQPAPVAEVVQPERNVHTMSARQIQKLREEERAKGKKAALAEQDAIAKQNGFGSHAEFVSAMAKVARGGAERPAATTTTAPRERETPTERPSRREQREAEQARRDAERARNDARKAKADAERAEREKDRAEKKLEAERTERNLERIATSVGINDTDYALLRLRKHVNTLSETELESFDERKFFEELKTKNSWLGNAPTVIEKPANTGVPGNTPTAPGNGTRSAPAPAPTVTTTPKAAVMVKIKNEQGLEETVPITDFRVPKETFRKHLADQGFDMDSAPVSRPIVRQ